MHIEVTWGCTRGSLFLLEEIIVLPAIFSISPAAGSSRRSGSFLLLRPSEVLFTRPRA